MGGREQSRASAGGDAAESAVAVLEVGPDEEVHEVTEAGEIVFRAVDQPLAGRNFEALEDAGVLAGGTARRYEDALAEIERDGTTDATFETAVRQDDSLQPIPYRVRAVPKTDSDAVTLSFAETATPESSTDLLGRLRTASERINAAETEPEVMERLERSVVELLAPTALDVRLTEPTTDQLWRITDATTVAVDPRESAAATARPYSTVRSGSGATKLDAADRNALAETLAGRSRTTADAEDSTAAAIEQFSDVAMATVGDRGVVTVGRIGTPITDGDLDALETLGEYAGTAISEIRLSSTVDEQQTELDRYETLVESIPDPVYSTDEKGRITVANRAFEREFSYDPDTDRGRHISEFTTTDSAATIREEIRRLVAGTDTDKYADVPVTGVPSDGRTRDYAASLGVVTHDGEFDGAVGVLRDTTDRQRQEEISKVLNRALRHNLRTTTNNIKGYAEVTQEQVDDDISDYMGIIQDECDWLIKLGDTLRDVRRSVQRGMETEDVLPVEELIEPVIDRYRQEFPAASLQAHYNTDGRVEGGTTLRTAVEQIIENAIVHNESEPSVEIWVANAPNDGWIDIHVEDNGPGIPNQEIELLMGETEITQLQHGSGLGLWVTRWLVETFDGELLIESEPTGSVVTLRLRKVTA